MKKIEKIRQLREATGLSVMACKKALEEEAYDLTRARKALEGEAGVLAEKKAERETGEGRIEAYIHATGKVGAMVELLCESDFVAKGSAFKKLAHELCLQVASMNPLFVKSKEIPKDFKGDKKEATLLSQPWIKDPTKTVEDLIKETIAKVGENIMVRRFVRYEI